MILGDGPWIKSRARPQRTNEIPRDIERGSQLRLYVNAYWQTVCRRFQGPIVGIGCLGRFGACSGAGNKRISALVARRSPFQLRDLPQRLPPPVAADNLHSALPNLVLTPSIPYTFTST